MLNVILGILLVSLASASGFMLIEQMSLTAAVADMRENSRRLDMAADAVTAKLGVPAGASQGAIYAPVPKSGAGAYAYPQIPDSIPGIHTTIAGVPFRYCPYAPDEGAATNLNGYLVKGPRPTDADVAKFEPAGILVAAGLRGTTPPSCEAVHVVDGRVTVEGGLARLISGVKGVSDAQLTDGSSYEMWVAPNAGGTGVDKLHPASLVAAMNVWKGRQPKSMVIHLAGGQVFADDGLAAAFALGSQPSGTVRSSKLSIVSDGGAVIAANATFDPQGSVSLVNVSMPQTVFLLGSHNSASFQNALVAGVSIEAGSSASFNGGVQVVGAGVSVAGDATVQGSLSVSGKQQNLVLVPVGGRLTLNGGTITINGDNTTRGIAVFGDLLSSSASSSIVASGVNYAVALQDGARMVYQGSIGAPGVGIMAEGQPSSLVGTGFVRAGQCWNVGQSVFAFSNDPASSRVVVPDQPPAPGLSPITGTQTPPSQEYVDKSNSRTIALAVAGINRSSWSCGS